MVESRKERLFLFSVWLVRLALSSAGESVMGMDGLMDVFLASEDGETRKPARTSAEHSSGVKWAAEIADDLVLEQRTWMNLSAAVRVIRQLIILVALSSEM